MYKDLYQFRVYNRLCYTVVVFKICEYVKCSNCSILCMHGPDILMYIYVLMSKSKSRELLYLIYILL